jgi:hypothetical protein
MNIIVSFLMIYVRNTIVCVSKEECRVDHIFGVLQQQSRKVMTICIESDLNRFLPPQTNNRNNA